MRDRCFSGRAFRSLGEIQVERRKNGEFYEYFPQSRYKKSDTMPLHKYGEGPFCKFRIAKGIAKPGLYVVTVDDQPTYVGECENADKRWGSNGYGNISPRNPFVGGQSTNCRINAMILHQAKAGRIIKLWFCESDESKRGRLDIETSLIEAIKPDWNLAKNPSRGAPS